MAKEYVIPITFLMMGYVKIKAESIDEALALATNADDLPIPKDIRYVEDTCHVATDDMDLIEDYTQAYARNDLQLEPEAYTE